MASHLIVLIYIFVPKILILIMNQKIIIIILLFSCVIQAQIKKDTINDKEFIIIEGDTVAKIKDTVFLDEVLISKQKMSAEDKKQFLLLQSRVYKTYPYARTASDRILAMDKAMEKLKTNKEKKKYFKIVEDYMENEFKEKLKKLSRKQGQILVKLIHRQTGKTAYDLVKNYKSGWKAYWSNNTAKLFDINLKEQYLPYQVNEDFLIETILHRAFFNGRLVEQKSTNPVDFYELSNFWEQKAKELQKTN